MLNEITEKRISDLNTICDELPRTVSENGWDDHARGLVRDLQYLAIVLGDERTDGNEIMSEILSGASKPAIEEPEKPEKPVCAVGVYIVKDGKILAGTRITPKGFNKICGPGGLIEAGESPQDAAIREAVEEFGVEPLELAYFGKGTKGENGIEPDLFLCIKFNGEPKCDEVEMTKPEWRTILDYAKKPDDLYNPFRDGIARLISAMRGNRETAMDDAKSKDMDWITIKGTHVPLDQEGDLSGDVGDKIKSSQAKAARQTESTGEAMKPATTDYEYSEGDSEQDWERKNIGKLKPIAKQGGRQAIDSEWRKFRMEKTTEDIHEISEKEADAVVYDHVSQSVYDGWYRGAGSGYKPKLVDYMLSSKEMRNAGLSLAYENYKNCTDSPLPFEEFLTTPITMYRGEHGQLHTRDDVFDSYSFDRKIAAKFAGKYGKITEAKIRPIDTYGSMRAVGNEAEIWVPREIAPRR